MDPFNDGTIFAAEKAMIMAVETNRYPVSFTRSGGLSETGPGTTTPLATKDLEMLQCHWDGLDS
jgi:hypothetical protein